MSKTYTWTVDVEYDWGGRTHGTEGLDRGIPRLLAAFKEWDVRALFFVSTEILDKRASILYDILNDGHEIGNHGHFHTCFKEPWRSEGNRVLGEAVLKAHHSQSWYEYRAPKFSYVHGAHRYSQKTSHVSVLRRMWMGEAIPFNPIFYIHPFDIMGGNNAPNLFCKAWYANPNNAYKTFTTLLRQYRGDLRLTKNEK